MTGRVNWSTRNSPLFNKTVDMIHWPGLWPGAATLHRELGPECCEWLVPGQPRHSARTVRCKFMLISRVWCVQCNAGNVSIAEKTDLEPGVTRPSPGERNLSESVHQLREYKAIIIIFYSTISITPSYAYHTGLKCSGLTPDKILVVKIKTKSDNFKICPW